MSTTAEMDSWSGSNCIKGAWTAREACALLRQTSHVWQEAQTKLERLSPLAVPLLEDLFVALFDPAAELNPAIEPAYSANFTFLAALMLSQEFKRLRDATRADAIASAGAALRIMESLKEQAEAAEPVDAKGVVQRIRLALLGCGRKAPSRNGLGLQTTIDEAELRLRANQCVRRAQADHSVDRAVRAAWGVTPGVRSAHAFDDVWRLLEEIRGLDGFQELTDALERFRRVLKPLASRRSGRRGWEGVSRIAGYTWGRNLDRVAAEEMVRLMDPEMSGLFYEAYDHRRLLQHDVRGERKGAAGPVICCMDVSASMNTLAALERERFLWCKGLGLALLDFSRQVGRSFLGLCFSSEADLEEFAFPVGDFSPQRAVDMAKCDFNGGTHFERPLRHALERVEGIGASETKGDAKTIPHGAARGGFASAYGADVIFIADGEASLRTAFIEEFHRRKAQHRVRLFTVFIDGHHPGLAALSDAVFIVRSHRIDSWEEVATGLGRKLEL